MKFLILAALVATASACTVQGKTYSNGETWISNNSFKMKCIIDSSGGWQTDIVACLTPNSKKEIPVGGGRVLDGNAEYECVKTGSSVTLKPYIVPGSAGTVNNQRGGMIGMTDGCGNGKRIGEIWTDRSFKFRCAPGGNQELVSCIYQGGREIPAGGSATINGFEIKCKQNADGSFSMGAN